MSTKARQPLGLWDAGGPLEKMLLAFVLRLEVLRLSARLFLSGLS